MRLGCVSLSNAGAHVIETLAQAIPCEVFLHEAVTSSLRAVRFAKLQALTEEIFSAFDGIVFVAPAGAVVRCTAPYLDHKTRDPAVVVVDVGGRYAVSLISGHEGGANALAVTVANILGAEPVITTTSDAEKRLIVGVGCRRGAESTAITGAIHAALGELEAAPSDVRLLASADIKKNERGLIEAAAAMEIPLRFIPSREIRACTRIFEVSSAAMRHVDLPAVAEPAALLAGRRTQLAQSRRIRNGVTTAIAREDFSWSASVPETDWTERDGPKRR